MELILLVQGANMCYLGHRQPEIYGTTTAAELDALLLAHATEHRYRLEIFYTNLEGEAIDRLYRAVDEGVQGLVMNPAGFNYAGYALRDCVLALPMPYIEVHMSNIEKRGIKSVLGAAAVGSIAGFGVESYVLGLEAMLRLLRAPAPAER
ncbi:MAG: type II 3-dehydroquinate dehydratase [Betaproteobacteria bacterium]